MVRAVLGLCAEGKRSRLPHTRALHPLGGSKTPYLPSVAAIEALQRGAVGPGSRGVRHEASCGLRRVVDRLRDGAEQGRHPMYKRFDRTGTGQVEENPVLVLFDLGGDFAEGRMTVEGCAWARAVCWRVCVRRA